MLIIWNNYMIKNNLNKFMMKIKTSLMIVFICQLLIYIIFNDGYLFIYLFVKNYYLNVLIFKIIIKRKNYFVII